MNRTKETDRVKLKEEFREGAYYRFNTEGIYDTIQDVYLQVIFEQYEELYEANKQLNEMKHELVMEKSQ